MKSNNFRCYNCDKNFEAEGIKSEYIDPVYGFCTRLIAICPFCGGDAYEYIIPKPVKVAKTGSCGIGNCCCGH